MQFTETDYLYNTDGKNKFGELSIMFFNVDISLRSVNINITFYFANSNAPSR